MFGRSKATATAPAPEPTRTKVGGKGRPTPSRRESEARNRHPLVGTAPVRPDATKAERKAARAAQRKAMSAERARAQQGLRAGDPKYLGPRDAGPVRAWVRDYVDARRNPAEFMMPAVVAVLFFAFIPNRTVAAVGSYALYLGVVVVGVDIYLLRRRVTRLVAEKFGDAAANGIARYAMMRALQMRMSRSPKARVSRGQFPT